jgi:bifunctional UDP-N-acetylglucosamine pyrophosphorylase / glucosamine-1-phosphate N-acetyltransferase
MDIIPVILAAGQGKRMHAKLPKVLHTMAGKPLLEHVINTTYALGNEQAPLVIYGHEGEKIQQALAHLNVTWVKQNEQLGTGHALLQALPYFNDEQRVLVLYGDVPLITPKTLTHLIQATPEHALGILTATFPNPKGLGRIIRNENNNIIRIVEEKDADSFQRLINEINSGIYLIPAKYLKQWLPILDNNNAQKEYYLTDIITLAVKENIAIHNIQPENYEEVLGVNDKQQLAYLERYYQLQQANNLLLQGVTLLDPARFDLRGNLTIGKDVIIDVNVIIEGKVTIGNDCRIGANTILRNVSLGDGTEIKSHSVIDGAEIAEQCVIGPFARLRPGTILATKSHIGNFVEIKNSIIGTATKVNHLSYVGDSEVGNQVNIGAGTITCNYDGVNKHKTIIGDYAFIGSNSQLVAPITVGEGATIGAGSTITRNAPAHQLTLCRSPQRSIANWKRPEKKEN